MSDRICERRDARTDRGITNCTEEMKPAICIPDPVFRFILGRVIKKKAGDSSESPAITQRRSLLRDDEGLRVQPIRVTQYAQCADLELIHSSQRQPTDSYFPGFNCRDDGPRPQYSAGALVRVPHV